MYERKRQRKRKSEEESRIHLSQPLWLYSEDVVAKNGDVHLFTRCSSFVRPHVSLRFDLDSFESVDPDPWRRIDGEITVEHLGTRIQWL